MYKTLHGKKVMHLVQLLEERNFPVKQVYNEIRKIDTWRFDEFLEQGEWEECPYSFNESDSYELINADVPET